MGSGLVSPEELVQAIHDSPLIGSLVVTGAGTRAIAALFAAPGASRTILDVQIPYSSSALEDYLGKELEQHCSSVEASALAEKAHQRATKLAANADGSVFGVSCTAAIATDRERRGDDRAHVAWFDGTNLHGQSITFDKDRRTRTEEDLVVSYMVLNAVAAACGVDGKLSIPVLDSEELVDFD